MAAVADSDEVLAYIERHKLYGKGIGYVDVHLLAAVALTEDALLWTRDKRLRAAAASLRSAYVEPGSNWSVIAWLRVPPSVGWGSEAAARISPVHAPALVHAGDANEP